MTNYISRQWLRQKLKYLKLYLGLKLTGARLILVYSNGKSATTSITKTLHTFNENNVLKVHTLNKEKIDRRVADRVALKQNLPSTLRNSLFLNRHQDLLPNACIITVLRDPLASSVSSFFENLERKHPQTYRDCITSGSTQPLREICHLNYQSIKEGYLSWLDDEIGTVFGLDLYSHDFPKEKGYQIIRTNNIQLLILKLEMLDKTISAAIHEFLGISNFQLIRENVSANKEYKALYNDFITQNIFSADLIDSIYSHPYVRHFYSDEEISGFRNKWLKNNN